MTEKPENTASSPAALALATDLHALIGRLRRKLRRQAHMGDLNWTQKSVLRHLDRNGSATVTGLARAEGMRTQSMGAQVMSLIKAGLVQGAPHPNDGRKTLLSLTPSCKEWLRASRALREDWLYHSILDNFTEKEQQTLADATALLQRIVDVTD